jgi:SAM-dependent methyltransferase
MAGSKSSAPAQHWDPARYIANAGFVAELGAPLLEWLQPCAAERILDLGCGDGRLTARIVEAGASVIGLDSSAEQVAAACRLGLDARVGDGEALAFEAEFDGVLSNAALHWMLRPDSVIAGVWRALKPGGRFVGEFGGAGNVAAIVTALVTALDRRGLDGRAAMPWYFPSPADYGGRLTAAGFSIRDLRLMPRPTPLPGEIGGWLTTFAEAFIGKLAPADRPAYIAEVTEALRPGLQRRDGVWVADYIRLRFAATKAA